MGNRESYGRYEGVWEVKEIWEELGRMGVMGGEVWEVKE